MKWGLLIAPLLLALSSCSGGSGGDDPAADPSGSTDIATEATPSDSASATEAAPEDALEEAYRTYVKAFLTGDGATAYQLLSERCRDKEPLSSFAATSEAAAELYGEVDYTIESVTVDGNKGSVDATYAVEALNSGGGSLWVYEGGGWRTDKCD